jgi:hypothetical protein
MGEPPFPAALFAGAVKETVACPFAIVATGEVGALGTDAGVIGPAVEAADVPVELVAVTENVYAVPLVKPAIVQLVAGEITVHCAPDGDAVTV